MSPFSDISALSPQRTPIRSITVVIDANISQTRSPKPLERDTTSNSGLLDDNHHDAPQSNELNRPKPTPSLATQDIDITGLQLEDASNFIEASRWEALQSRSGGNISMALMKFLGLPVENPTEEEIKRLEHAIEPYYAIWRIKDAKERVIQLLDSQAITRKRNLAYEEETKKAQYGPQIDLTLNDYLISDRLEASYSSAFVVLNWLNSGKLAPMKGGMNRLSEIHVETKRGDLIPSLFYGPNLLQSR